MISVVSPEEEDGSVVVFRCLTGILRIVAGGASGSPKSASNLLWMLLGCFPEFQRDAILFRSGCALSIDMFKCVSKFF